MTDLEDRVYEMTAATLHRHSLKEAHQRLGRLRSEVKRLRQLPELGAGDQELPHLINTIEHAMGTIEQALIAAKQGATQ